MKTVFSIILLSISIFVGHAQSISVSRFKLLDTDLTANTAGTMETDQNGETAALIKVVTTQTGFTFDGGVLGIVKTKQTPGEVWVYVPRGSKKISVKHPQLGVLRDYNFPIAIEAARTYEMVLVVGEIQTIVKKARTSQYVVFQLTPPNAVVELDGELLQTTDGTATKMMRFGTYNYRIQAPNYLPEAGNITVDDPNCKHIINISLKPNFSVVTLKVDGEAEIWLNGDKKGNGVWTGNLGAGMYEIETKKPHHRTVSITKDISVTSEPQIINLQSPMPIYGEADFNSTPAMADIYIDGIKYGQTPQIIPNLLTGEHSISFKKNGYKEKKTSIVIKEGESTSLSAQMEELTNKYDNITIQVGNVDFQMIKVEGGSFLMGSQKWDTNNTKDNTKYMQLSSFYIGETEVTQDLWEAVMGENPSGNNCWQCPVVNVSWDNCQEFIKKLCKLTGRHFRLPKEAEWEFAASGGIFSNGYRYSGSDNIDEVACYGANSKESIMPVKSKKCNELGLYDMSGNVFEWCEDKSPRLDNRIARGGSWSYFPSYCCISERFHANQHDVYNYIGLRLVLQN